MKFIALFAVGALIFAPIGALAKDPSQAGSVNDVLTQTPAAELPAMAAKMVKQAKAREWGTTTISVVKAAVAVNPAATPAVVGAIAKSVPEMASVAAGTAAAEQPKLAAAIARAAAASAPSKTEKIVAAVCRAVPNEFRAIAIAVAAAVPGSAKEVLKGVAAGIPELKAQIGTVLAAHTDSAPSVSAALDQVNASSGAVARGPSVGPPYVAWPGAATTVRPITSDIVEQGQRDYARP